MGFQAVFQSFDARGEGARAAERLAALRAVLGRMGVDGFIVPRADEFQGEYCPPSEERLLWLTGFSGSAGSAIVLKDRCALFVDGRYTAQAAEETDRAAIDVLNVGKTRPAEWLIAEGGEARIGYDPRLHTVGEIERLAKAFEGRPIALTPLDRNPIDLVWTDRPSPPVRPVTLHPERHAGRTAADKIADVRAALARNALGGLVVSDPHATAWLFNIRGGDVPHTPLALGYALVPAEGEPALFLDGRKLGKEVRAALAALARLAEPAEFDGALEAMARGGVRVRLDKDTAGVRLKTLVEAAGGVADVGSDPIALLKARKNAAEIAGAGAAHLHDGVAMARFLAWFDETAPKGKLTEIDAAAALETFRRETGALKDIAFTTIAAAGPNAALPHYRVSRASNRRIEPGLFLIDSGGQYLEGTTDITRTIAVGKVDELMKDRFTRVLKGMIAISEAVFPAGTSGAQLDPFARAALWRAGLDFDHGTGHGIGSYLSVHEGPQRISKLGTTALEPGMILSNEPGYYREGAFGIRIENLVIVEERAIEGAERPMLGFRTLSFTPIDRRLIAKALLTAGERAWLNAYHAATLATIGPLLDDETRAWLEAACRPV
jgi:Xaa-Pro aminopeptidase